MVSFRKDFCEVRFPLQKGSGGGGGLGSPLPRTYISNLNDFFFPIISYPYLSFPDQLYYQFCTMLCLLHKSPRGQGVLQDKWSIVLGHEALCYFKILVFGTLHYIYVLSSHLYLIFFKLWLQVLIVQDQLNFFVQKLAFL